MGNTIDKKELLKKIQIENSNFKMEKVQKLVNKYFKVEEFIDYLKINFIEILINKKYFYNYYEFFLDAYYKHTEIIANYCIPCNLCDEFYKLTTNEKKLFIMELLEKFSDNNYLITDDILHLENIEINLIKSLNDYSEILNKLDESKIHIFRGHSLINYQLIPSLFRDKKLEINENKMVKQLIATKPKYFVDCENHLDYLAIMQHYELPTRLLDFTLNPLIALYFACSENINENGEVIIFEEDEEKIKNYDSDVIEILANLAFLDKNCKEILANKINEYNNNDEELKRAKRKMFHSIKSVRSWFDDSKGVLKEKDLEKIQFVFPKKNSERIKIQNGLFAIFGLNYNKALDEFEEKRVKLNGKHLLIVIENKTKILKSLKSLGIDDAYIYPEIEYQTHKIKEKYSSEIFKPYRKMYKGTVKCWDSECKSEIKIVWIEEKLSKEWKENIIILPNDFTLDEKKFLKQRTNIVLYSNPYGTSYNFGCAHCGKPYSNRIVKDDILNIENKILIN